MPDGSLTLHLQKDSPGADKESNWLPAPNGEIYLVMRLYWPKTEAPSVLPAGEWHLAATGDRGGEVAVTTAAIAGKAMAATASCVPMRAKYRRASSSRDRSAASRSRNARCSE